MSSKKSFESAAYALVGWLFLASGATAELAFDDVSDLSGVSSIRSETWGASWGDVNGDGYPDLFVGNHRNTASLFQNNVDGTFTDIALQADVDRGWTFTPKDTHGAAWGDFDGDGDQDLALPHKFLFENVDGVLRDITASLPLPRCCGSSAAWLDHNNDGLLDLTLRPESGRFGQGLPGGGFQSTTGTGINCGNGTRANASQFLQLSDLDGQGRMEVLCGSFDGSYPTQDRIYSLGSGIATAMTLATVKPVRDAAIADFDNDGDMDLLLVRGAIRISDIVQVDERRIEAFMNVTLDNVKRFRFAGSGEVTFEIDWNEGDEGGQSNRTGRPWERMRIGSAGTAPAAATFTLNSSEPATHGLISFDPATDKVLAIGYDPVAGEWEVALPGAFANEVAWFAVTSPTPIVAGAMTGTTVNDRPLTPALLSNDGSGTFADVGSARGLAPELCVSAVAGDFDNDMDIDLYLVCRGGSSNLPNVFYENRGDGQFDRRVLASAAGPVGVAVGAQALGAGTGESVVSADYDLDGFLDLFVTNGMNLRPRNYGGPHSLFRNRGNGNNWLLFDLRGTASSPDGIGAQVYVRTPDGRAQRLERNGGYHRWSQNHKRLHVGLAGNSTADVEVRWPSGTVDLHADVPANALYRLNEGGVIEILPAGRPRPYRCGQPAYSQGADQALYLWQNCFSGQWQLRATGGGTDTRYTGQIRSSVALAAPVAANLEGNDSLTQPTAQQISFDLRSGAFGQDGFSFTLPADANSCFEVTMDPGAPVRVGEQGRPFAGAFTLPDLAPCDAGATFQASYAASDTDVLNLATAEALLASGGVATVSANLLAIDLLGGADSGRFPGAQPFPFDDRFALRVTGTFRVDAPGEYSFLTRNDDGVQLRIDGVEVIRDDDVHSAEDFFGTIPLAAGAHTLDLVYFESGGDALLEVAMARGRHDAVDGAFRPLLPAADRPIDTDTDGLPDDVDNCPFVANPDQANSDGAADGGDRCDTDDDNDGLADGAETSLGTDPRNPDTDGDGLYDGEDPDPLIPAAGPNPFCGAPQINSATVRATFLWSECDGTDRWFLRTTGGGATSLVRFSGALIDAGAAPALAPFSLEANDQLQLIAPDERVEYLLSIYNRGIDGFDFTAMPDTCLLLTDTLPLLTGRDAQPSLLRQLRLRDGAPCPLAADTDGDGLSDDEERALGTDINSPDTDGDRLTDSDEVRIYGTDPLARNTDLDGLTDFVEVQFKGTDPLNPDTDGDGLSDGAEASQSGLGTDPLRADTDGGGVDDGAEVAAGTDPLDPSDD